MATAVKQRPIGDVEQLALAQSCPVCSAPAGKYCNREYFPALFKDRATALEDKSRSRVDLRRVDVLNGVVLQGTIHYQRLRSFIIE